MPEETAWVVIPARGGSKGIPGKNLRKVGGRTLIGRAVDASEAAARVSRVFVSTDDTAIAAEAASAGAEVIVRPSTLAGDDASSEAALLHALDTLEAVGESLPQILVLVQCTSPFVTAADIDGTIAALAVARADAAFSAAASHRFLWRIDGEAGAVGVNHDKRLRPRRQDRAAEFVETGSVYAMRVQGFRQARHRFFGRTVIHEVSASTSLEIDDPDDLAAARALAPLHRRAFRQRLIPSPLGAVLFDFDGVFTDDRVIQDDEGGESVICSRADGYGISLLHDAGIAMAVVSRERNPVVARRCEKLKLRCLQGVDDKLAAMAVYAAELSVPLSQIVFVGNDLPDIPCIEAAGLGVAVADAHPLVRAAAGLVLDRSGGMGAVRELAELILAAPKASP